MSRRDPITRALLTGTFVFAVLAAACGRAPSQTVTQVGPPPAHGTAETSSTPHAPLGADVVETDRGAVVVDRPAPQETSAVGGTMGAIAKVITLPFTIILGIFEILF